MTGKYIIAAFLTGMLVAQSPATLLAELLPAIAWHLAGVLAIPLAYWWTRSSKADGAARAQPRADDGNGATIPMAPLALPAPASLCKPPETKSIYVLQRSS